MKLRVIGLATLCLALVMPVLGQGQRGRRGGFGTPTPLPGVDDRAAREREFPGQGERDPLGRLEEVLDLTASQLASLEPLVADRDARLQTLTEQARESREVVRTAIEGGDPATIGNAVLAQKALQDQTRTVNEEFLTALRSLLTLDQQETLDTILALGLGRGRVSEAFGSGESGRQGRRARGGSHRSPGDQ